MQEHFIHDSGKTRQPAACPPCIRNTRSPQDLCRHRFSCRRWSPQICCCRSEVRRALHCNRGPGRCQTGVVSPANMKQIWSKYQSWGSCRWFFCQIRVDHSSYHFFEDMMEEWTMSPSRIGRCFSPSFSAWPPQLGSRSHAERLCFRHGKTDGNAP